MAQETTGAGTAKSKDPGMTGSDLTGMTEEERDQVASKLVDRFSLWSGAAGLIPIPLVDMAAVGGVQLQMLRRLSEIYGVPFSENRGKSIIASLAGAVIPASTATTTAVGVGNRRSCRGGSAGRCGGRAHRATPGRAGSGRHECGLCQQR